METIRPRCILTNDGECDDMNTYLHLLLYANDIDIEGLVYSSSVHHYAGDPARGIAPKRWEEPDWMGRYLDVYAEVCDNLRAHDSRYPSADALRSVVRVGNIAYPGEMDADTPGSELIRAAIMREEDRPVYLLAGGGTNTIARALKRIEADYRHTPEWERVYRHVCTHAIVYTIQLQDDTYRDYIAPRWPGVRVLHANRIEALGFGYDESTCPDEALRVYSGAWMREHILNKGPLGALYHTWLDGHYYQGDIACNQFGTDPELARTGNYWLHVERAEHDMLSEGDSPSILYLVKKGLRGLEDPGFGSWGGRFERAHLEGTPEDADYWEMARDDDGGRVLPEHYQLSRWIADWMNDFSCRLSWSVTPEMTGANHAPRVRVVEGVDVQAAAGGAVELHAEADDSDGDELMLRWFIYRDAGSADAVLAVAPDGGSATVRIAADAAPGDAVRVVVRVSDEPAHADDAYMVAYQQVIVRIALWRRRGGPRPRRRLFPGAADPASNHPRYVEPGISRFLPRPLAIPLPQRQGKEHVLKTRPLGFIVDLVGACEPAALEAVHRGKRHRERELRVNACGHAPDMLVALGDPSGAVCKVVVCGMRFGDGLGVEHLKEHDHLGLVRVFCHHKAHVLGDLGALARKRPAHVKKREIVL